MVVDSEPYLSPLLVEPSQLRRAATRRRKLFDEKRIKLEAVPESEAAGWQIDRRFKKPRALAVTLQNGLSRIK